MQGIESSKVVRRPDRAAITTVCAAILCALFGASGCTPSAAPTAAGRADADASGKNSRRSQANPKTTSSIRTGATYKKAVAAYRARHFAEALRLVDALLATPSLSAADKAFLTRQKQLCQAAVSGKPVSATAQEQAAESGVAAVRKRQAIALSQRDCGPRALLFLCQAQRVPATLADLTKAAHTSTDGTSMKGLAAAAQTVGLTAKGVQVDKDALARLTSPAIAWVDGNHYIAVLSVHDNPWTGKPSATIHDPNHTGKEEMAQSELLRRSGGIMLTVSSKTLAKRQ